jgi:hypothetical protein
MAVPGPPRVLRSRRGSAAPERSRHDGSVGKRFPSTRLIPATGNPVVDGYAIIHSAVGVLDRIAADASTVGDLLNLFDSETPLGFTIAGVVLVPPPERK